MILVFAPTYTWAKSWAEENELRVWEWRWVTRVDDVRGYERPAQFVVMGDIDFTEGQYEALQHLRAMDALLPED